MWFPSMRAVAAFSKNFLGVALLIRSVSGKAVVDLSAIGDGRHVGWALLTPARHRPLDIGLS